MLIDILKAVKGECGKAHPDHVQVEPLLVCLPRHAAVSGRKKLRQGSNRGSGNSTSLPREGPMSCAPMQPQSRNWVITRTHSIPLRIGRRVNGSDGTYAPTTIDPESSDRKAFANRWCTPALPADQGPFLCSHQRPAAITLHRRATGGFLPCQGSRSLRYNVPGTFAPGLSTLPELLIVYTPLVQFFVLYALLQARALKALPIR